MKVALYARVSTPSSSKKRTAEGDRERQDPEVQLVRLRAYAEARGWEVSQEYIDRKSGADPNRPALRQLEEDISSGKVDAVLVVRLDRIMRSIPNFVAFLSLLENDKYGGPRSKPVALIAIDQSIDTSTPAGRLMRTIIMAVAEYEKDIIRDRVLDGMVKARNDGKTFGRPKRRVDLDAYREALKVTGNAKAAAKAIGVPYSTIRDRLKVEESKKEQGDGAEKGGAVCL
jgi:DNA invertase Pin-like site-specific DNA recombinase